MACSTPGLPVHHQLPEFTQTHVYWLDDAIQPSHPLSSPSPPAFTLSQHQGLFQWVGSSHQVAKVLEFQLQHQSFQWTFRTDFHKWYKMRTFGPQLRNKDSQRAIRPRVVTCVLPSSAARGQGEAQREPDGSAPGEEGPSAIGRPVPLFSFTLSPPDGGPAMSEDTQAILTQHIHSFLPRVRRKK